MSDYAFVHNNKAYTPNQTEVADPDAHNKAIEEAELAYWQTQPERMLAYYSFPAEERTTQQGRAWKQDFYPYLPDATVSTWRGKPLGTITSAHVYRHNFGSRMVSIKVQGTNGATYYGRASYDNGTCINLRKARS